MPRHPSELDIIVVRNPDISQSHHARALQFLINNNIYFSNITINSDNLSVLPDDDTISNPHMCTIQSNSSLNDSDQSEDTNDPHHLATTFIPGNYHFMTEEENIRASLQQSSPTSVPWPSRDNNPINNFSTEGSFSCAFPTLFPAGSADY